VLADWDFKIEIGVRRVRLRFSDIVLDSGAAQCRTGQAEIDGFFCREDADAHGSLQPDSISVQKRLVLVYATREYLEKVTHSRLELRIGIPPQPADAKCVRRQSRANEIFKYLEYLFALAETVQQHGDRADIHRVSSQPQQMRRDTLKLGEYDSQVFGS